MFFVPCAFVFEQQHVAKVLAHFEQAFTSSGQTKITDILQKYQDDDNFCRTLFSHLDQSEEALIEAAKLYTCLMQAADTCTELMSVLFKLADAILTVKKTPAIYKVLMPLIVKASLSEEFDSFEDGSRLTASAFAGDFTADSIYFESVDSPVETSEEKSTCDTTVMVEIEKATMSILHTKFMKGGICKMSATDIDSYPIMFPFDSTYFDLDFVHDITTLCRRVMSTPFTEWSSLLYKSQYISDTILNDRRQLRLNLSIPFQQLIESALADVMDDSQEEEDEPSPPTPPSEPPQDPLAMSVIAPSLFFPSITTCNDIVAAVSNSALKPMPQRRLSHC